MSRYASYLLAALLGIVFTTNLHAQLVPDGSTLTFTGSTNLPGDLIVGTNGGNTLLDIKAPGAVTNANGYIGYKKTSDNNQIRVENSGAVWQNSTNLNIGYDGSGNQLIVTNGGVAADYGGYIGYGVGSNNLAVVTGPGSLWTNNYGIYVGYNGTGSHNSTGNQLIVSNGGVVFSRHDCLIGVTTDANSNVAVVTGSGSLWINLGIDLEVGQEGSKNQLVVSNGAVVFSNIGELGNFPDSSNNLALVTGTGSLWTNTADLYVGNAGSGNQLVVSNGAVVAANGGSLGYTSSSSNNAAVVTGNGSLWNNFGDIGIINVGLQGSGNQLVVNNGGKVVASYGLITGSEAPSADNRVIVDGGNLIVTNYQGIGALDVRGGTNVFNDGFIQADRLLLTNSAGFFEFNGGTFITGGGTVDNGQPFVVGAGGTKSAYLDVVSNAPLTLNNGFILGANTAVDGNQLLLYSGGVVSSSGNAFIGLTASNNLVVVDETGSSWTSSGNLYLGSSTAGNRLTVAGGGVLADAVGVLGSSSTANNNLALVRDAGSLWNNSSSLYVGVSGSGNQLVVTNGAVVADTYGTLGNSSTASNNVTVVTGAGSLWNNSGSLYVGDSGSGNQLVVSDGGTVQATSASVGVNSSSTNNRVTVEDGNLIITSSGGTGTLNILHGASVLNAGLIQADNLSLNSSAGFFEFNGGTLITGGGTVNNGQPFVVGASGTTAAILDVRGNTPLVLNKYFTLGANTAPSGNQLLVTNGGVLSVSGNAYIGLTASNNQIVVDGTGSSWTSSGNLYLGSSTAGNRLTVGGGGVVADTVGQIGNNSTANNNLALVRDAGSLWNNSSSLYVGVAGSGNQLMVSNGAVVASAYGILGSSSTVSNNLAVVTGAGSLWNNSGDLYVGQNGSENQLVASDAGTIQAADAYLGFAVVSTKNRVTVDGGNLIVTNSGGTGTLDIRRGTNVLNAGLIQTDNLLLTNSAGFFDFNGGTLITGGGTVNNGQPFVVGASGATAAILDVRTNAPLMLDAFLTLGANTAAAGNQLLVTNGGTLSVAGNSYVGVNATGSNNLAVVSGPNSLWTNSGALLMGLYGSGNQLVVSNGGTVANTIGSVGDDIGANNNLAVVTGAGSVWTNSSSFAVGYNGSGNQLMVNDGGLVADTYGTIGGTMNANSNLVVMTGPGSLWINSGNLYVGYSGSGNRLVVTSGGTVQASGGIIGLNSSSTNNRVTVDGGNLIVTSLYGTGTLDIRRGTNVLNAGLIQADNLLLTNSAGFFEFNGGTLITSGSTVSNGQAFVVGNGSSSATLNLNVNALHTFNNGLVISSAGTLKGNGTVAGLLTVQSGGTVMPGNSVGTLVLSNSPALQGSVLMEISKTGATLTSDQIQVTAPLTYGGNLVVSNLGPDALAIGNSFQLFSATSYDGAFTGMSLPSPGSGLMWTNQLLLNGSIAVVAQTSPAISGLVKSGTNLVFNVSGGSPGGAYDVLTSTNVALPLVSWSTNSSGNFDWMGNTTITNGIDPADPQRFFTISEH